MRIERFLCVKRPPEEVFDHVSYPSNFSAPAVNPGNHRAAHRGSGAGGTRIRERGKALHITAVERSVISRCSIGYLASL
jgi:hypothetical protein